jgi:TolA-binding protein
MSQNDRGHDRESVARRLAAVERAVSGEEPLERTDRLDELEVRIDELEAAVQALRGYVGSVRAVNEDVERRADRALRTAEAIERNVAPTETADAASGPASETDAEAEGADGARRSTPLDRLKARL